MGEAYTYLEPWRGRTADCEMLEKPTAFGWKHTRMIVDLAIILVVTIVVFRTSQRVAKFGELT